MNAQVPFAWFVIALFVPPVLAFLGVIVAQSWQDKREHRQWLREQRLSTYEKCLSLASDYHDILMNERKPGDELATLRAQLMRMRDRLDLVGTDEAQLAFFYVTAGIAGVRTVEEELKTQHGGTIPLATGPNDPLLHALNEFEKARTKMGEVVRKELQGRRAR